MLNTSNYIFIFTSSLVYVYGKTVKSLAMHVWLPAYGAIFLSFFSFSILVVMIRARFVYQESLVKSF